MQILIEANGGDGGEAECILVNLTQERALELLALREKVSPLFGPEGVCGIVHVAFRDHVSAHTKPVLVEHRFTENTQTEEELDSSRMGTYWSEIHLDKDGVNWAGAIKHSPEIFSTGILSWNIIEQASKGDFSAFTDRED